MGNHLALPFPLLRNYCAASFSTTENLVCIAARAPDNKALSTSNREKVKRGQDTFREETVNQFYSIPAPHPHPEKRLLSRENHGLSEMSDHR